MKTCSKCNKSLLLNKFGKNKQYLDGLRGWCNDCSNTYQRDWNKKPSSRETFKRRREKIRSYINSFKDKPCMDCGVSYPSYVMDFDHVRGQKKFELGLGTGYSISIIKKEIDKCDIVCANCHRVRTFTRKND